MTYAQQNKWQKKHPKGTRQPIIFSTGSGFWPSHAWLEDEFWPYLYQCKLLGKQPMKAEDYYNQQLKGV